MSDSMIQEQASLVGTKWLVSETKRRFTPFYITFNANGQATAVTINKIFTGNFTWSGDFENVNFIGGFNTQDKGTFNCLGSPESGNGHYSYTWSGPTMLGKFTMVQQSN